MKRLSFLKILGSILAFPLFARTIGRKTFRFLRPPGSLPEEDFLNRCIRCNQCSEVCPNDCIRYMDLRNGLASWGTPYIVPREQACILCMKCGDACPTGAIQPIKDELPNLLAEVHMGRAVVDKDHCLSYQGKTCGVCYRACPFPGIAMTIGYLEQPTITADCIGCGLCERSCIQLPQAVRVIPVERPPNEK